MVTTQTYPMTVGGLAGNGVIKGGPVINEPGLIRVSLTGFVPGSQGVLPRLLLEVETWRFAWHGGPAVSLDCPAPLIVIRGSRSGAVYGHAYAPAGWAPGCTKQMQVQIPGVPEESVVLEAYIESVQIIDNVPRHLGTGIKADPAATSQPFPILSNADGKGEGLYIEPTGPSEGDLLPNMDEMTRLLKWLAITVGVGAGLYLAFPLLAAARSATKKVAG